MAAAGATKHRSGGLRAVLTSSSLTVVLAVMTLLLVVFAVLPLAIVVYRAFVPDAGIDLRPVQTALADGRTWSLLGSTALMAALTSLGTVLLGVPAAWALARTDVSGRDALRTALATPYVVPPYITAIGWITLLNPQSGLVNKAISSMTGAEEAALDIYTLPGMVFVLAMAYFPLVMLQANSALESMDPSLEEAARTSGASPLRVLFTITLPLIAPAIGSGALLTFLVAMASFGVPYLVGNPGRVEVLTTAIYAAIDLGTAEATARAITLAVLLGVVAALALLVNGVLIRRGRALLGGKAGRPSVVELGNVRPFVTSGLWLLVIVAVVIPITTLVVTSFIGGWGRGLNADNIGFENYVTVFSDGRTLGAMWTSVYLAVGAATICTAVGMLASYMRKRTTLPGRRIVPFLAELPYAVPGTVLAMGFILAFSQEIWVFLEDVVYLRFHLFNTAWILLVAYSVKYLAFGVRGTDAALTQIDISLEEAARTSGASPLRVVKDVVVPLLRPALVAAWILVFLPALSEITMSILLFSPGTKTLGVLLFDYQTYESPPKAAVLGTLLVVAVLSGNFLVKKLTRGKLGF